MKPMNLYFIALLWVLSPLSHAESWIKIDNRPVDNDYTRIDADSVYLARRDEAIYGYTEMSACSEEYFKKGLCAVVHKEANCSNGTLRSDSENKFELGNSTLSAKAIGFVCSHQRNKSDADVLTTR
jgi:hypothetical protein